MRTKRIIISLLLIISLFVITSCNQNSSNIEYSSEWTYDSVGHWHKSLNENSETRYLYAMHTLGDWYDVEGNDSISERKCDVCGYKETRNNNISHTHTFADTYTYDDDYHWFNSTCGHDVISSKAFHIFTKNDAGDKEICSLCGYEKTLEHVHTFSNLWEYDDNTHYHNSTCGHNVKSSEASHTLSNWITSKEPTEEEFGERYKICVVCNYKITEQINKLEHTHTYESSWTYDNEKHYHNATCGHELIKDEENHELSDWTITKEATIDDFGERCRECVICGYRITEQINKLDHVHTYSDEWEYDDENHYHNATCSHNEKADVALHTYSGWVRTKKESVDEEGERLRKCLICGYEEKEIIEKIHVHTYDDTYSFNEKTHYYAATCGHDLKQGQEEHDFGEAVIEIEPKDYEDGKMYRICNTCSYKYEEILPSLNHVHTYDEENYSYDEDMHFHSATCHNNVYKDEEPHEFNKIVLVSNATCDQDGVTQKICEICGYVGEIITLSNDEHTYSTKLEYDEEGHYYPAICSHKELRKDFEEHTFEDKVIDPTCEEKGYTLHTCSVCGYSYKDTYVDDLGHNYGEWKLKVAATCTENGSKYRICANDDTHIEEEIIKYLGHDFSSAIFVISEDYKNATCTLICNNDESHKKTYEVSITKTVVDATCVYAGKITYTAAYGEFSDTIEVEIKALDHDYVFTSFEWESDYSKCYAVYTCLNDNNHIGKHEATITSEVIIEATCTRQGKIKYTATYQNNKETEEVEIDALGHLWSAWEVITPATTTSTGLERRICQNDSSHTEERDIAKLSSDDVTYDDVKVEGNYSGTYYDNITTDVLSDASLLKSTLNNIINNNYKRYSYSADSENLKTVDSYDDYYVECIYTGIRMLKSDAWDKEHVWAKSYGFKDESYDAYSDMHHLRVSEHSINVNRSSSYFDEVANPTNTDSYGNKWTTTVFEPRDEVKGDVARMLFYMVVKYDDNNLDLELTDDPSLISDADNQTNKTGIIHYLGLLSTLVKWHFEDPVDAREVSRNNTLYESYQKNRNPFIDHPEYVYYLYTDVATNYVTEEFATNYNYYINYNIDGINAINTKIDSIGTVSLNSGDLFEEIWSDYNNLGSVTKSFVTNYHILNDKYNEYVLLTEKDNQDTTTSTSFSFVGLTYKSGSMNSNGVEIEYSAGSFHANHGIYAQIDKNGNKNNITIDVDNLYDTIKYIKFTWNDNNYSGDFATVVVTNNLGESKTFESLKVNKATSNPNTLYNSNIVSIDISELSSYDGLNITIINNSTSTSSLRLYNIEFALS